MPVPQTVFDKPLQLLPDKAGARFYANVDNAVEVTVGVRSYFVAVAVPTELFTFMKEVAHIPPEERVNLGLDFIDGWYVFSMLGGDKLFDLWATTEKTTPAFLLDRRNAIPGR